MLKLFDPTKPPDYPAEKADAQIARRAAQPPRLVPTRSLYICGTANPAPETYAHASSAVLAACSLVVSGWRILVNDSDGLALTLIGRCKDYDIPYLVLGANRNPRTAVSPRCYIQVDLDDRQREYQLIDMAEKIVAFERPDLIQRAGKRYVPGWLNGVEFPVQTEFGI